MTIEHLDDVSEFPLTWPDGKPRTAGRGVAAFKTSMAKAQAEIRTEMERWHARGHVVSMAPQHRQGPVDPGVALWWNMPRRRDETAPQLRVLACDQYLSREDNLHAIGLTLKGLRAFERYGTYTVEQAIEGARPLSLPRPAPSGPQWWKVLEVGRDWPLDAIEAIYRTKAEKAHPDRPGGSAERMSALNAAIGVARTTKQKASA